MKKRLHEPWFTVLTADDKVHSVHLNLTPDEWCDCCQRDGEQYIGGCCGNTSTAQDYMNAAFRDGGTICAEQLEVFAELLRSHEGWDPNDLPDPFDEARLKRDPWARVVAAWETVKDCVIAPRDKPVPLDPNQLQDAVHIVHKGIRMLDWWSALRSGDSEHTQRVARADLLWHLVPALRTVYTQIERTDMGEAKGFAVCLTGTDKVLPAIHGLAIFPTRAEALKHQSYIKEDFDTVIRPVTISAQTGLKFEREE